MAKLKSDVETCGNCYLWNKNWGRCLLTGDSVYSDHTCDSWLAEDTCKSCLIDYEKKEL